MSILLNLRFYSFRDIYFKKTGLFEKTNVLLGLSYFVSFVVLMVIIFKLLHYRNILKCFNTQLWGNLKEYKQFFKLYYTGLIYPNNESRPLAKYANYYDYFIKKFVMIFMVVFFNDYPIVV